MNISAKQSLKGGSISTKQNLIGTVGIGSYFMEQQPNSYILVDEDGNEIPAFLTNEEVILTATVDDIREGTKAVTEDGVVEGELTVWTGGSY